MSIDNVHDPRARLVREKYFSLRPRPLERWLWSQRIPASAERVFWLHWQAGMKRGDWCSEVPIKRVAAECHLDTSTVTRAYQLLARLGCLRRTDPGREPGNPFQQATAVTEVRVPRELLVELDRHPNRTAKRQGEATRVVSSPAAETPVMAEENAPPTFADPFAGLTARDRLRALSQLTRAMSAAERRQYDESVRTRGAHMSFDADSKLSGEERGRVLQQLSVLAAQSCVTVSAPPEGLTPVTGTSPRKLSVFELARLKRDVQAVTSSAAAPELMRQVAWSIEEGSLRRFSPQHAIHIALKKIRDGLWTRPNRMPPNWARSIDTPARPGSCGRA